MQTLHSIIINCHTKYCTFKLLLLAVTISVDEDVDDVDSEEDLVSRIFKSYERASICGWDKKK